MNTFDKEEVLFLLFGTLGVFGILQQKNSIENLNCYPSEKVRVCLVANTEYCKV